MRVTMNVGPSIFGAHFGAYSFRNYIPLIAAILVAAVVGEIVYNAKLKRQRREQAQRISRMRRQVQRQRMRRDLALLEAEKRAVEDMERRAAARLHLYLPEAIERQLYRMRGRRKVAGDAVEGAPVEEDREHIDHLQIPRRRYMRRHPMIMSSARRRRVPGRRYKPPSQSRPETPQTTQYEEEPVSADVEKDISTEELSVEPFSAEKERT